MDILSKRPYDLSHSLCTLVAVASSSFLNNARNEIISPSIDLYTRFLDQYYPETIKRASNVDGLYRGSTQDGHSPEEP